MAVGSASRSLKVLICGGGVAGPALGYWLARGGHQVTLAERFPALRATGAQVDLRGQGIEAVERRGLLETVRSNLVDEAGVAFVNAQGRTRATIRANTSGRGRQSLTSQYEITRGDLVRILHDATKNDIGYRFSAGVERFEQDGTRVIAHFADGSTGELELLVAADGQGSRIRQAILPPGSPDPYRRVGIHMAYWFVPRIASDSNIRDTYWAPGGRMIMRRSHDPASTQVYFVLREQSEEASAVHRKPVERQKQFWAGRFRDAGWQTQRFVDGMSTTENSYSQEVVQVRTSTWSNGRVALVGDAAYCRRPTTGWAFPAPWPARTSWPVRSTGVPMTCPRPCGTMTPRCGRSSTRSREWSSPASCDWAFLRIPDLVTRFSRGDRGGDWQLPDYS